MSAEDSKRYYWLKLKKDFFNSKRMKKMRSMAGGDTFVIIYLKLQLLAIDKGGILTFDGLESDVATEFALDIDEKPDDVRMTLLFLMQYGLCETSDDVNFFLPYCVENTGSETGAAIRKRVERKQEKQIAGQIGTLSPILRDRDREIERDKDKERDKKETLDEIIEQFTERIELRKALNDFVEHRKFIKKPLSVKAMKLNLNKLSQLSQDEETQIEIINQSIANGWQGFFALNNNANNKFKKNDVEGSIAQVEKELKEERLWE